MKKYKGQKLETVEYDNKIRSRDIEMVSRAFGIPFSDMFDTMFRCVK